MELQELFDTITTFVQQRRESDGGYAVVETDDMEDLWTIFRAILQLKWERDPDGDLPINLKIIDRTRLWPLHYEPLPYDHHVSEGKASFDTYMTLFQINAGTFRRELDNALCMMKQVQEENQKDGNDKGGGER